MFEFLKPKKTKKVTNDSELRAPLLPRMGYENPASGTGTDSDKRSSGQFEPIFIPDWELEALYEYNALAARIINLPVDDMLKNWRSWEGKESDVSAVKREEKRLKLKLNTKEWLKNADLYGGAVLIPYIFGQDDKTKPLDISKVGVGDISHFVMMARTNIHKFSAKFYDLSNSQYLRPDYYQIVEKRKNGSVEYDSIKIHPSWVFEMSGQERPQRIKQELPSFWGISRLCRCYKSICTYEEVMGGLAQTITSGTIDVIKDANLADARTTKAKDSIDSDASKFSRMRSIYGMLFLDKDAEYDRKASNFSGLAPSVETVQEDVSLASGGIPVTKLFGKAKAGMSGDTNDGDIRNFNSDLEIRQDELTEHLAPIDELVIRSALGVVPADLDYFWNPISVVTGKEAADIEKAESEAAETRINSGQVAPEETRHALKGNKRYKLDETAFKKAQQQKAKEQNDAKDESKNQL